MCVCAWAPAVGQTIEKTHKASEESLFVSVQVFPNCWPHLGICSADHSLCVCVSRSPLCVRARRRREVALVEAALQLTLTSRLALRAVQSRHCPWNWIKMTGCVCLGVCACVFAHVRMFLDGCVCTRAPHDILCLLDFLPFLNQCFILQSPPCPIFCHCLFPQIQKNLNYSSEVSCTYIFFSSGSPYICFLWVWVHILERVTPGAHKNPGLPFFSDHLLIIPAISHKGCSALWSLVRRGTSSKMTFSSPNPCVTRPPGALKQLQIFSKTRPKHLFFFTPSSQLNSRFCSFIFFISIVKRGKKRGPF